MCVLSVMILPYLAKAYQIAVDHHAPNKLACGGEGASTPPGCEPKVIYEAHGLVSHEPIQVDASGFSGWVPIYPPLRAWIIEPVKVVVHPAVEVDFLAGKAIG